ncbi:MAG: NUDIX domain-containing protein [Flavobacteriaceae bacterium]|jgi:8-oxo-dGTP pyrophosphatase MutT (NUDIX family)|nr:NUDIX domain-containing protein [Flavobacteriaceae bacterium]MDG1041498.1 NUDIX domain-containing protein [Flavobacteriaceae bacterium]MDG1793535.1 NUDIX domain-containing protein [Flavobacteriaceae bacterium]
MYKIFVGNKPIVLTTALETETDFKNFMIDAVDINKVLSKLKKDKYNSVRIVGIDKDVLLKKFLALLPNVIAGGGKVYNPKNEILFIFRNGKWDLPKGKAEAKETINQTALREVEEETGITGLSITKPLEITYHIFKRNERHYIKVTYWFQMYSEYEGTLIPQEKEGITKVKWIPETKLKKVLNNSYSNIKLLI